MKARLRRMLSAPWRLFTWLWETHPKQTVGAMLLLVALSAVASGYANIALGKSNARNAVTQCENANESRESARNLWQFVADLSVAGNPDPTPAEALFVTQFRAYINKVYVAHDCSDLSRKYPAPKPPSIPGGSS